MKLNKHERDKSISNEELIFRSKNGCEESKELLYKNNYPTVKKIVHKHLYGGWDIEKDDAISIAFVGMQKAYNTYDPCKGIKFITLLWACVSNEIRNNIRNSKLSIRDKYRKVSMDEHFSEEEDRSLHDILSSNNSNIEDVSINNTLIHMAMSKFSEKAKERELYILKRIYYDGMNNRELALELGVTHQRVEQIHKKCLEKLRKIMKIAV